MSDAVWPRSRATKCKKSAIVFNVTLANGYQSGKFVDHGDLGAMSVCQDLCCQSHKCDAAFMAGKRCFSVHCHNQVQCLWMRPKTTNICCNFRTLIVSTVFQTAGVTGKTTPAMSHNPLKGRRIETTPAQSRSPLKGVTGKTKPPMSRNRTKAGQNKSTLAPSQHHSEGVAEKTSTPAASRSPVKVEQGTATQSASRKGEASPTERKTAQAASHNAVTTVTGNDQTR
ncbi:hypothetical protein OS493_034674 [Desmophyllum pertusum]|uniref:MANSC domain-containing protein n=1 Tax=Desmophyllum pertusum TaxID=174260 RepID=A0A9X0D0S0_9CNID|nr:hypothetical protein OS493_034674 [Desmophyllum pertusum]